MPAKQTVRSEIEIAAAPELVFDILTDLERYPEWNPFTPRIESTLQPGDPVDMRVRLRAAGRLQRQIEFVTAHDRPERLCWGADIPLGFLIRADRCQTLTRLADGGTRYVTTDDFGGLLAPLVMRFFSPAIQRGFDECAAALKRRAESRAAVATPSERKP